MANKPLPSPEVLRQLLSYDPETGKLFWKERPATMFPSRRYAKVWNDRYANSPACFSLHTSGYFYGCIWKTKVYAHRLAWAIYYGDWPNGIIDHHNGDPGDNRIHNLRIATSSQNGFNRSAQKNSKSGIKGVSWRGDTRKWRAAISSRGEFHLLGHFDSQEEAKKAYAIAAKNLHGDYARVN